MKKTFTLILLALLAFAQTAWAQNIVSVDYVDENGTPQNVNATSLDDIINASANTDHSIGNPNLSSWFVIEGDNVVLNGRLGYYGHMNLILCDGAKLTINNTNGNAIESLDETETITTLTIYVQEYGTGQLVATATSSNNYNMYKAIQTENLTIYGGVISATGGTHGIYASSNIVINGGTVTANGNDWGIQGDVVTINGGNVTANGGIWSSGMTSTLTVGYTNSSDRIYSTKYKSGYTGNTMMVKDGQYMITTDSNFIIYGYVNDGWKEAIAGHTLMPYTPTEWSGSGDSATDPYIIATVDDLNLLSLRTNGSSEDYTGKYFKLGANITYTPSTTWNDASSTEHNFTAIAGFDGHFDGDGYTISGLRIYANDNFHDQNGLFSNLGPNAYIEDVTLSNARIAGQAQVGGIAGYVQEGAMITNCHVTGTVAVHALGHTLQDHGGVVGKNHGTISNCVSEATISSGNYAYGSENVGGIAGYNKGSLSNNKVFNADITAVENCGAIAGLNVENGSLTNNYYNACTVNGVDNVTNMGVNGADVATNDGAIAVFTISVPDGVTASATATFTHNMVNYYKDGVTVTLSGGLDDTPTPGWQKAYYINGVALQENSTTVSYTFDMPAEDVTITIGEIHADWATSGAQGTEQDPYLIYFTDQLDLLAIRVNNGTTYDGKYFKLMDDLTYSYNGLGSTESNYTPIGSGDLHAFHGHFDGNNKSVSGIRIRKTGTGTDACFLGLFGSTDRAEVKDVTIKDTQIVGHRYLGGVVGHSWSSMVSGCHVWYNVSIILANNDSNTAGGIVGYNRIYQTSTVTNCISEVHIYTNGDSDCFNIGGIVGLNGSVVSNNFVMSAYIDGGSHFGAIVGQITEANALSNNYYRNCVVNNVTSNVGCDGADVTENDGALGLYTITINAQDVNLSSSNEPTFTYQGTDYWKSGLNITLEGGLNGTPAPGYQIAYFINGEAVTENTFVMPANDVTVTVGECHADWETANAGTEDDPYLIYFTDQLDLLASRTNNDPTKHGYADKYFKLMNDLTYSYEGLGATESNYTPIGGNTNHFYGHFDGNNKTISGIRIYKGGTSQAVDDFLGLFGYMDYWYQHEIGDVKNLTLDDAVITGNDCVGGIVGRLYGGTVDNCHVTSSVIIHTVVDGTYGHGGIAGDLTNHTAAVSHCTSSVTLTVAPEVSNLSEYGGIVGCCYSYCMLTDNFAIGATVPGLTGSYSNGAITGAVSYGTLERNYYQGCKVGSENVTPSGVGCGGYNVDPHDITENDGAVPVFTLSVASGITAEAEVAFTRNDVNYYKLDTPVTLSYDTPAPDGSMLIYYVNGTAISGNSFNMTADANVTLAIEVIDWEAQYQGSEDDPYLIYTTDQWNMLSTRVNDGNSYTDKYFKLMDNISVTTMVGTHPGGNTYNTFGGTFNGDDHTITVNYTTNDEFCGPFCYTYGATIKNLATEGTINTSNTHAGGVVGRNGTGNLTMSNVKSSVTINSTYNGSAQHGGLVGYVINGTLEGCAFTGQLLGSSSNHCGGLVGWKTNTDGSRLTLIHCIFNPSQVTVGTSGSKPFVVDNGVIDDINCYYFSTALGTSQGKQPHSITGGTDVTLNPCAIAEEFTTSGITAYNYDNLSINPVIMLDGVIYSGNGDQAHLYIEYTGTIPDYNSPVFTASAGTLEDYGDHFSLWMPDNDVIINYDHYVPSYWSGSGTETDPYLIYTNEQWDLLAEKVNTGNQTYNGEYFKLMADITISYTIDDNYPDYLPKLVGYDEDHSFQGTFDGNNHKITLDYYDQTYLNVCAPFRFVKNATIKRLLVDGEIQKEYRKNVASIVGDSYGTTNLISCYSEAGVYNHKGNHTNDPDERDGTSGGLVGRVSGGTINLTNCSYNGKFAGTSGTLPGGCTTYTTKWGGLVAYVAENCTANLINCFCEIRVELWDTDGSEYFARKHSDATLNLINCYRSDKLEYPNPVDTNKVFPNSDQGIDATNMTDEELHNALGYAWMTYASTYHDHHVHPVTAPQTFTGQGTESEPYQIATAEDWDKFAIYVAHKDNHSSDYFQMTDDISTTNMVGLSDQFTFQGTFDGAGNTLNLDYNVTYMPDNKAFSTAAPFTYISNAAIKDLHITGNIATVGMRPASVAGFVVENSTITNCKSEVALSSSYDDDIDAGGFVARVNEDKSVTLTGCLFTGSINYSNETGYEGGGMVGWTQEDASATLTDCVFAPSAINITKFVTNNDDKKHRMFVGGNRDHVTLTNCYYNGVAAGSGMVAEGERVYSIVPGQNVTMQLYGIATDYTVSGISIYGTGDKGLKFDDVFHAVSGNVLDLNLGVTVPYTVTNYLANGEVITFSDTWNNYTLTMPEEDVAITATFSDVAWGGEGTEESPYLIYYNVQWDLLATNVNAGNNYNGEYFKLMDDISVETMVGSTNRPFRGIFDGGGHTLTFNKGTEASPYDQNFCAPFKAVEAATIKNLHTTGAIYTSKQHAAGFVAQLIPNTGNFTRFIGCRSSMKINSTVASDARTGGFIGSCSDGIPSHTEVVDRLSIFFEDCLFDGEFSGTATGWGGFVGYYFHCESIAGNSGMVHFTRCLFAPSAMNIDPTDAYNFVHSDVLGWSGEEGAWIPAHHSYPEDVMTITKLYYTITCGNLEVYFDEVQPTPVGNMTNVQLRDALGDNWMIVIEDVEKVVPTMGNVVTRAIAGYGEGEGGYVLLASPVGTVNPAHVAHMLDNEYDLYAFDQAEEMEWRNYEANAFNLEPGKGYLYANSEDVTLIFPGVPYTGDGEVILSKTDNTSANFQGWNLVGNPFNETAYIADGRSFYTMNSAGSEITPALDNSIAPMEGVFVIAGEGGETLTFTTSEPANNGKAMLALNLSQGHGVIDRAILRFGQGGLLPKFQIKNNSTKVYIQQDNKDYAVVNAEAQGEMPVSFKAKENGNYTLSLSSEEVAFSYLHLIDNMTGNDVDMLQTPNYTFNAKTTDYASRFKLVFATKDGPSTDSETFAFYSNGSWVISNEGEATLQVIDVNGRILSNEAVNGSVSKAVNAAPGVYVIRLINGDDVKTQKIVVR